MSEECLLCKAPLVYLDTEVPMECALCRRMVNSRARCINGHFVCDDCHRKGMDAIIGICLGAASKNPAVILESLMDADFCHMHGPEHHGMVGAALLTAFKNAGGQIDPERALAEMIRRGREVPGGVCGFWGACGAAISTGIFVSILTGANPLTEEPLGLANRMTSRALHAIGTVGGPRCCKRNSYLAVLAAVDFVREQFGIEMEKPDIVCGRSAMNSQCIGRRCPFSKAGREARETIPGT